MSLKNDLLDSEENNPKSTQPLKKEIIVIALLGIISLCIIVFL